MSLDLSLGLAYHGYLLLKVTSWCPSFPLLMFLLLKGIWYQPGMNCALRRVNNSGYHHPCCILLKVTGPCYLPFAEFVPTLDCNWHAASSAGISPSLWLISLAMPRQSTLATAGGHLISLSISVLVITAHNIRWGWLNRLSLSEWHGVMEIVTTIESNCINPPG